MVIVKILALTGGVLLGLTGLWLLWPVSTPPFPHEPGKTPIAEMAWVTLGDLEQWALIRGADRNNPALLVLHGGPGTSEMAFFRAFNAELEQAFTVIHWDQRAAGKSFTPKVPTETLVLEQYVSDLDELVDHLRRQLGQDQLILLGHSWGTTLGILYAFRYPEKVAAYIGIAQMADMAENERRSYEGVLAQARAHGHPKAIAALEQIGPPPYEWQAMLIERSWVSHFGGGPSRHHSFPRLVLTALWQSEVNIFDLLAYLRGEPLSLSALWPHIAQLNLTKEYQHFAMPVFFVLGRHDRYILPELAAVYFDQIVAPDKALFWFEDSAHSPPFEEPERFNRLMIDEILPRIHTADHGS